MHGLQPGVLLAIALAWTTAYAEAPLRQSAPQTTPSTAASLPHHDAAPIELFAGALRSVETARVHVPGASYVKLHFARFELPDGVTVEVANPSGTEVYRYRNGGLDGHTLDRSRGDDGRGRFFAMSVTGETALVRLTGKLHRFDPDRHGVVVDHWVSGNGHAGPSGAPASAKDEPDSHLETTCGVNERFDARCYQDSHPAVYDRSIPVAKVITAYGEVCTAWRVGPSNRMFTVQHCISGQDDLDGAEIWFQYRAVSCGASSTAEPIKVTGGELLATDGTLDYALFTVDDFDSIAYLGHLGLDVRNAELGEGIFIPQHGLGQPKQIALESDMNVSGFCEVDDPDHKGYAEGSDIGYFCDTTTSSSGSPVVSRLTGDVIALHHLGGCFNSASKMSLIWPQVSAFFGGVVPHGDGDVPWYEDEPASEPGHGGANLAPEADFTYACDGLDCQFDASASMDDDGYIETYSWDFGDGATGSGIDSNHEFGQEGSYTVTLNVVDDQGGSDSYDRTVTVTAPNQPPKARLSAQCIDNACQFSGAASSDPDGQVVSWSWKFGDGVSASGSQVSHEYAATGSYTVTLTVKDDKGASDIRSYTATVRLPNQAPHAEFELDCSALQCRLDASASADPDGSIVVYLWDLGDGQTATGVAIQHRYAVAGDYRVSLTVEDEGGALASTSRQVRVEAPAPEPKPEPEPEPEPGPEPGPEPQPEPEPEPEPEPQPEPQPDPDNRAPKAGFAWECEGLRCAFDGELSRDSDGEVVSWQWDFGDGRTASGAHYTHRFRATGRFRVNLVVEDDDGAKSAASIYLDVEAADSSPVAEFSVDCSERSCKLDAGSSTASDSGKMRFDWSFGDGATGQGRTVTHDYARDGVYRVTLKVSDGKNLSDTHSRTVEVVSETSVELRAEGSRMNGRSLALLTWAGAEGDSVQIHRDGKLIATPPNTGKYLDRTAGDLRKAARYQVCDSLGESCSVEILVALGPAWSTQPAARESLPGKFKR